MSFSWQSMLFVLVIALGNFLMIGAQLIGISNSPAILISGDIQYQNTPRYIVGILAGFFLQSLAAVTLSVLIISWLLNITSDGKGAPLLWIIGFVGAIYPIWQAWGLSRHERAHEPESYIAKLGTSKALPFSLIITIIFTVLFVLNPTLLSSVFYWLLGLEGIVILISIISIILSLTKNKR